MPGDHDITAVDVRVRGDVQGVGYRFATMQRAASLDVSGWVRNEPDGDVTAHLEGLGYRVDSLLEWMRHGTQWSRVTRVDVNNSTVEGLDGFSLG